MRKITERDTAMAWEKLRKAGLTERQLEAIRRDILWDAIHEGETRAEKSGGVRCRRIMPHWSLQAQHPGDPDRALAVAIFWHHAKHRHFWDYDEATDTTSIWTERF